MNDELRYLLSRTVKGTYSRRAFLGRATAMGLTAAMANTVLATAVRAEGPKKGGTLKIGLQGGESTVSSLATSVSSNAVRLNLQGSREMASSVARISSVAATLSSSAARLSSVTSRLR